MWPSEITRFREYFGPEDDGREPEPVWKGRKENSSKVKAVPKDTMDEKWIELFEALVNTSQAWETWATIRISTLFFLLKRRADQQLRVCDKSV